MRNGIWQALRSRAYRQPQRGRQEGTSSRRERRAVERWGCARGRDRIHACAPVGNGTGGQIATGEVPARSGRSESASRCVSRSRPSGRVVRNGESLPDRSINSASNNDKQDLYAMCDRFGGLRIRTRNRGTAKNAVGLRRLQSRLVMQESKT